MRCKYCSRLTKLKFLTCNGKKCMACDNKYHYKLQENNKVGKRTVLSRIFKVWGIRDRILETDTCEIDLLELLPNSFCSVHSHKYKINKFIVLSGELTIKTDFGECVLKKGETVTIEPPIVHQFRTKILECQLIEIAYVNSGEIDLNDIDRIQQGGRIINGVEYTLDEMKKKNLLKILEE